MNGLGRFFEAQQKRGRLWLILVLLVLAGLACANIFITSPEPHFRYDAYPEFWPVFGFSVGCAMILVLKKILARLIHRPEDFYGDSNGDD